MRPVNQLDELFLLLWPKPNEQVSLILQAADSTLQKTTLRSPTSRMLCLEMAALLRQQNAVVSAPKKFLAPVTLGWSNAL